MRNLNLGDRLQSMLFFGDPCGPTPIAVVSFFFSKLPLSNTERVNMMIFPLDSLISITKIRLCLEGVALVVFIVLWEWTVEARNSQVRVGRRRPVSFHS